MCNNQAPFKTRSQDQIFSHFVFFLACELYGIESWGSKLPKNVLLGDAHLPLSPSCYATKSSKHVWCTKPPFQIDSFCLIKLTQLQHLECFKTRLFGKRFHFFHSLVRLNDHNYLPLVFMCIYFLYVLRY